MEELSASSSKDDGWIATRLNQFKRWFLSHAQYLNFFTVLVLASVSFILLLFLHYNLIMFILTCYLTMLLHKIAVNVSFLQSDTSIRHMKKSIELWFIYMCF